MGLRRRIVKTLLKKYVKNLQERHIHVNVSRGIVCIDDAVLDVSVLSELLQGLLPDGLEIAEAKASDLRLDIPWKHLKSRSTTISIGEVSVELTQYPAIASGLCDNPCAYWETSLKQRKQMLQEAQALARKGLLPIWANDVVTAIMAGLQVSIDTLILRITKCRRVCGESSSMVVKPHAEINIADFFLGPVDQRLQKLTTFSAPDELAYQSKHLRFGAISLKVITGGQLKKLLHPTAVKVRIWSYMPSDGKLICPFTCTTRLEIDLDTVCIDGDEEQVRELLRTILDFSDAMEIQRRALGRVPWSNDDYDLCFGGENKLGAKNSPSSPSRASSEVSRRPSTGSITGFLRGKTGRSRASSRASSPTGSVAGSEVSVPNSVAGKSSRSTTFRRMLPTTSLLTRKKKNTESAAQDREAFLLDALDDEDSDTLSVEEDMASKLDDDEFGDTKGSDFHTPMGAANAYEEDRDYMMSRLSESMSEALTHREQLQITWNDGSVRQDTIILEVATLSLHILFPGEARAEVSLTRLSYRQIYHAWLTEAEQICASRIGGRFANATARSSYERGGNSVDTIINIEHELSSCTCYLSYSEFDQREPNGEVPESFETPEDNCQLPVENGTKSLLIEPLCTKEENIVVKWRGACGEPCCDVPNNNLSVWPVEVVVRKLQLLYLPAPFQRISEIAKPVIADMVVWDEDNQLASSRARAAQWTKIIELKDVAVQKPAEDKELPHRVRIQAAILENVTSDFKDIGSFLGLVHEEQEDRNEITGEGSTYDTSPNREVNSMTEEQLRAEVLMWRSTYGHCNGQSHTSKETQQEIPKVIMSLPI